MKTQWLNVVLLLTNRIYERKKLIISGTGLKAIANIFILIIFELTLAAVSLPLYLTLKPAKVTAFFAEKGAYAKIAFDYNLRRLLTLGGMSIFAVIWLIKLTIILSVPALYGPLPLYSIGDFRPADISAKNIVVEQTSLENARILNELPLPKLDGVDKISNGYIFYGTGQPNSSVVLLLSDNQSILYTGEINKNGRWQVIHNQSNFRLNDGNHSVNIFVYNKKLGVRSQAAPEQYFKVTSTWLDSLLRNYDVLTNWSVVIIVLLGVFLTFLTI